MWDIVLFDVLSDKNRTAVDGFLYFVLHCEQKCPFYFHNMFAKHPSKEVNSFATVLLHIYLDINGPKLSK